MRQNPLRSPTAPKARPMANPADTEISGMAKFPSRSTALYIRIYVIVAKCEVYIGGKLSRKFPAGDRR
jgi:hypothetical protein